MGMNFNCENCGWSENVGSSIMCKYNDHITWRDECCEAWKPKEKETNMVEVVRCEDCKHWLPMNRFDPDYHTGRGQCEWNCWVRDFDWFCADGERK